MHQHQRLCMRCTCVCVSLVPRQDPISLQDLLSKILVANPDNRFTIKDIIQHRWFQTDLPSRALKMNDDYLQLTPEGQGFQQLHEIKAILADAKTKTGARKKEDDLIVAATELQQAQ